MLLELADKAGAARQDRRDVQRRAHQLHGRPRGAARGATRPAHRVDPRRWPGRRRRRLGRPGPHPGAALAPAGVYWPTIASVTVLARQLAVGI